MSYYNNKECQLWRLKLRFKLANQTEANAYLLPWPLELAKTLWCRVQATAEKKQLTLCQRLIAFLQAKESAQTLDYFTSFHWIEPESALPPPQEIFSLPDMKLTLGICQSHLKHYRVTDYTGAVFNHSVCSKKRAST